MKNNKVLIGILLVIVVGVWAKVFLKISSNLDSQEIADAIDYSTPQKVIIEERKAFELKFSGLDPFLKKTPKNRTTVKSDYTQNYIQLKPSVPALNWPDFQYYGFVKGTNKKTKLSVLKADGTIMNLREGETFYEGFKIKRAYRDSIIIGFGNKSKTIYKK